jgi:glutamine cyclotransferase
MRNILNPLIIFLLLLVSACISCKQSGTVNDNSKTIESADLQSKNNIYFESPKKSQQFKDNEKVQIKVNVKDTILKPDSVLVLIDGKQIASIVNLGNSISWDLTGTKLGLRNIEAIGYYSDGQKDHTFIQVSIQLQKAPQRYTYKVINTYLHDKNAYTQGLIFDNGYLFESTGIYGQSSLRKVNIANGEPLKTFSLPNNIFGEGITMFDNKIIQVSWREQVAFLFDKETFQLLNKFYYPIKEGWGITYDGTNLIMSDGSPYLYFLDKDYFTELLRIEVFDENGPLKDLNELEYIDGEIWANVYSSDIIVKINPKTGAVTGKIYLSGLLKPGDKANNTDVLNGIAYDAQNKKLFVTGKNWPKLFEIKVFPEK